MFGWTGIETRRDRYSHDDPPKQKRGSYSPCSKPPNHTGKHAEQLKLARKKAKEMGLSLEQYLSIPAKNREV